MKSKNGKVHSVLKFIPIENYIKKVNENTIKNKNNDVKHHFSIIFLGSLVILLPIFVISYNEENGEEGYLASMLLDSKLVYFNENWEIEWEYKSPVGYIGDFCQTNDSIVLGIGIEAFYYNQEYEYYLHEINEDGETIWTFSFASIGKVGDIHDIDYIPERDSFLIASAPENSAYEIDREGNILWEWNAADYFTAGVGDWAHLNNIAINPDGGYIISLGYLDKLIAIDEDGAIIANMTLDLPHHPVVVNNSLVACETWNDRVVMYERDNWTMVNQWDVTRPRSLLVLDDCIVVCSTGGVAQMVCLDYEGNVLWIKDGYYFTCEEKII